MDVFVFTIMNTGTRSVRKYYQDQGHNVDYMHALPEAIPYLENENYYRVTTIRNPRDVANSWMKGKRFRNCDWRAQWSWWEHVVMNFEFDKIIVLEDFDGPVIGKDSRPVVEPPWGLEHKIQFALQSVRNVTEKLDEQCQNAGIRDYQ